MFNPKRGVFLSRFLRFGLLLLLVTGAAMVVGHWELVHPMAVRSWVGGAGVMAPFLFVVLFALAAVLFIPATVMILAGGALFGVWQGGLYNLIGATLGAVAAFLISRYLARDFAERRAGGRLRLLMAGVREEGWKFVLFVRLAGIPYFVLNYLLGLTPIGLTPYTLASVLGMLPSLAAITYAGHIGFEAVGGTNGVLGKLILAIALVGVAALVPVVVRIIRKSNHHHQI